jgi:hypothetical protein
MSAVAFWTAKIQHFFVISEKLAKAPAHAFHHDRSDYHDR